MAVTAFTQYKVAEEIWLTLTGGATQSEPTLEEVQKLVEYAAGYVVKMDFYEKLKMDNQHEVGSHFIVRYPLTLVANDAASKKVTLPSRILDLPRDKGLYMVTYGVPENRVVITTAKAMVGPSSLRSFAAPYYGVWNSDTLYVYDRCSSKIPKIPSVNIYAAIANETTLPDALNFLIMQEVLKKLGQPRVPDMIDDQNNTR